MSEKETVIEILTKIQAFCRDHPACKDCAFQDIDKTCCLKNYTTRKRTLDYLKGDFKFA